MHGFPPEQLEKEDRNGTTERGGMVWEPVAGWEGYVKHQGLQMFQVRGLVDLQVGDVRQ